MIKEDLIINLAQKLNSKHINAKKTLVNLISCFEFALIKKKKLTFSGFGRFELKKKKKRIGRNPKTKKEFPISERYTMSFYASQKLKNIINKEFN